MGELIFKFIVEELSCGQKAIVLLGKTNTGADQICSRLHRGLIKGEVGIGVEGDTMSFVCDGATFNFKEDEEKLLFIKNVLERGNAKLEPREESNFSGFELSQSTR